MSAGLAHEIRNPLGGIRGAAQLLDRALPGDEHREYTEVIISEVDRLQALTSNMLVPGNQLQKKAINILEVLEHLARQDGETVPRLLRLLAPTWYVRVVSLSTEDTSAERVLAEAEATFPAADTPRMWEMVDIEHPAARHRNHMHVRFRCAEGDDECR